jgi:hypothetical protein
MSYLITSTYDSKFIQLSLSADQTVTTASTLVDFDTIVGDAGYECSLVAGGSGRFRLKGGKRYFIFGTVAIDRTSITASYSIKWYNNAGVELTEAAGACDARTSANQLTESMLCQLIVEPSSDTDYDLKVQSAAGDIKADGTYLMIMEF